MTVEKNNNKKVGFLKLLKYFGPGAILASMTIGAGNIVLAPRLGAWAVPAYSALWIVLFAMLTKGLSGYMATRYSLLSGEHIMTLFARVRPRGWVNVFSIIIGFALLPFMISTFLTILGNVLTVFTNVGNFLIWGVSIGLLIAALGFFGTFKLLQSIQLVCALFLAIGAVIAIIVVNPDFFEIFVNLFNIQVPKVATWVTEEDIIAVPVLFQLGAVYGTMNGAYADFTAYISWWRNKVNNKKIDLHSEELKGLKVDLSLSLIIVAIFTIAFMVAGTIILGGNQEVPNGVDLISAQQSIYETINEFFGQVLYPLAILVVIGGTIYAGMDAVPRMIKAWGDPISKRIKALSFKKFQAYIVIYLLAVSIPLMIIERPIIFMTIYLLITGVFGMWLLGWGALWANQTQLPEEERFSSPMFAVMFFSNIFANLFILAIFVV